MPSLTKKEKIWIISVLVVYLIVTAISVYINEVKVFGDAFRYLEYAENLKEGFYIEKHNFRYFGYVVWLYSIEKIPFLDYHTRVIVFQYLLSGISLIFLFQAAKNLSGKIEVASVATLLFMLFVKISFWNSYLLCEALYVSIINISLYFLIIVYKKKRVSDSLILALLAVATAFIKPTGIAFGLAIFVVLLYNLSRSHSKLVFTGSSFFLGITGLLLINRYLQTYDVIENYQLGEIVSGVSIIDHIDRIDDIRSMCRAIWSS